MSTMAARETPAAVDVRSWLTGIRTILVPPDIVAVPRRSPPRVRKSTPWHPQPDGQVRTERVGQREWFSDRLFVESHEGCARSGYGASLVVHACAAAALLLVLISHSEPTAFVRGRSLFMPAR